MHLSTEKIKDLASDLECGYIIYVHKTNKAIQLVHPEVDYTNLDDEDELDEEELLEKNTLVDIEKNPDNYHIIKPMESNEAFDVMKKFTGVVSDHKLHVLLKDALGGQNPFSNFKNIIKDTPQSKDWFNFNENAYCKYISNELKDL